MKINPISFKSSVNEHSVFACINNRAQGHFNYTPIQKKDLYVANVKKTNLHYKKNIVLIPASILAISLTAMICKGNFSKINPYTKELANSLGIYLNKKIKSKDLSNVISGKQLLEELKILKKENFIASQENIKNGTFLADLHSHSLFSDGKAGVSNIMEQVAQYADNLNAKTKKKFIFALTDHDGVNGVKEALKIIAQSPNKFKNVKFVTGAEMSFAIKSDKSTNAFEIAEMLIYGFNPFDKKISNYIEQIHLTRKTLAQSYINELNNRFGYADFSLKEFCDIYRINSDKNCWLMNSQWKVHHYGQTKNAIAGLANSRKMDKTDLYEELMNKLYPKMSLGDLRDGGLVPGSFGDDSNITKLCREKYSPNETSNITNYAGENDFDEIVKVFGQNDDTFFAIAHPYYLTEKTSKPLELIEHLKSRSKGFLKGVEVHHQAYNKSIDPQELENFNKSVGSYNNFSEFGGRDNHEEKWL